MTHDVSQSFAKSQNVNPDDFLTDGENPEQAKIRIMAIVAEVVKNGLSMRDGELHFGVSQKDMDDTKVALSFLKSNDTNHMRHSNDSLVNAMGAFVSAYQRSQMKPEKGEVFFGGISEEQQDKVAQSHLRIIKICLDNMHQRGLSKDTLPRQWDTCGRGIGHDAPSVPAEVSLANNSLRHRTFS